EGMTDVLKHGNTSYIVLVPKFDNDAKKRPYVAILTKKNTPYAEKLLKTGKYNLATSSHFANGIFNPDTILDYCTKLIWNALDRAAEAGHSTVETGNIWVGAYSAVQDSLIASGRIQVGEELIDIARVKGIIENYNAKYAKDNPRSGGSGRLALRRKLAAELREELLDVKEPQTSRDRQPSVSTDKTPEATGEPQAGQAESAELREELGVGDAKPRADTALLDANKSLLESLGVDTSKVNRRYLVMADLAAKIRILKEKGVLAQGEPLGRRLTLLSYTIRTLNEKLALLIRYGIEVTSSNVKAVSGPKIELLKYHYLEVNASNLKGYTVSKLRRIKTPKDIASWIIALRSLRREGADTYLEVEERYTMEMYGAFVDELENAVMTPASLEVYRSRDWNARRAENAIEHLLEQYAEGHRPQVRSILSMDSEHRQEYFEMVNRLIPRVSHFFDLRHQATELEIAYADIDGVHLANQFREIGDMERLSEVEDKIDSVIAELERLIAEKEGDDDGTPPSAPSADTGDEAASKKPPARDGKGLYRKMRVPNMANNILPNMTEDILPETAKNILRKIKSVLSRISFNKPEGVTIFDKLRALWVNDELRARLIKTVFYVVSYMGIAVLSAWIFGQVFPLEMTAATAVDTSIFSPIFKAVIYLGFNMGGAISIFALGITPYITSQIVIQLAMPLLTKFSPSFAEKLKKEEHMKKYSKYLAIIIAMVVAIPIAHFYLLTALPLVKVALWAAIVAGTAFAIFMAELVSKEKLIKQGATLFVALGIASNIPVGVFTLFTSASLGIPQLAMILLAIGLVLFAVSRFNIARYNMKAVTKERLRTEEATEETAPIQ
ncbi:MAG: hypothetical protein ABH875_07705, partial [Candidatus Omnitrophota bacterium]